MYYTAIIRKKNIMLTINYKKKQKKTPKPINKIKKQKSTCDY